MIYSRQDLRIFWYNFSQITQLYRIRDNTRMFHDSQTISSISPNKLSKHRNPQSSPMPHRGVAYVRCRSRDRMLSGSTRLVILLASSIFFISNKYSSSNQVLSITFFKRASLGILICGPKGVLTLLMIAYCTCCLVTFEIATL